MHVLQGMRRRLRDGYMTDHFMKDGMICGHPKSRFKVKRVGERYELTRHGKIVGRFFLPELAEMMIVMSGALKPREEERRIIIP